jgi:hypothetical protein
VPASREQKERKYVITGWKNNRAENSHQPLRHRFPSIVIQQAVWLYFRFAL